MGPGQNFTNSKELKNISYNWSKQTKNCFAVNWTIKKLQLLKYIQKNFKILGTSRFYTQLIGAQIIFGVCLNSLEILF